MATAPTQPGAEVLGTRDRVLTRWAKRGHLLAYLWSDPQRQTYVSIVSPDGSVSQTTAIEAANLESELSQFFWLPDDRHVAVVNFQNNGLWRVDLLGVDGIAYHDVPHALYGPYFDDITPLPEFSADGDLLSFTEWPNLDDHYHALKVFHVDTGRSELVIDNLIGFPAYATHRDRLAATWRSQDVVNVDILDFTGKQRFALIRNAGAVKMVAWSPDDKQVVVAWTVQDTSTAPLHITFADIYGANRHDQVTRFPTLYDLAPVERTQS